MPLWALFSSCTSGTGVAPSPLLVACAKGDVEAAQRELQSRQGRPQKELHAVLLDARDKLGRLPIHLAARCGGEPLVRLLLQAGGSSDDVPQQGARAAAREECADLPAAAAAARAQAGTVAQAAGAGAAVQANTAAATGTRVQPAAGAGAGAEVAAAEPGEGAAGSGRAAPRSEAGGSLAASSSGVHGVRGKQHGPQQEDRMDLARAMASALDTSGLTPLHYAAAADDAATCRLLLRCGAPLLATSSAPCYDPQLPCNAGSTVLHVAAMHNAVKAADAILTEWVNLSTQQRLALWNPHAGAATGAKGSPMDLRAILDKEGKTACMVAATRRFHTLVGLLDAAVPLPLPEDALPARPPAMLCCPITLDLMNDPVVLADGHTYERAAIEKWLLARATSPLTNLPLPQRAVYPNLAVRQVINEWRVQHGLPELPRPAPAHGSGAAAPPGLPGAALGAASGGGAPNAAASPFSRNRALSQVDEFIQDLGPRRRGFMATAIPA